MDYVNILQKIWQASFRLVIATARTDLYLTPSSKIASWRAINVIKFYKADPSSAMRNSLWLILTITCVCVWGGGNAKTYCKFQPKLFISTAGWISETMYFPFLYCLTHRVQLELHKMLPNAPLREVRWAK